MKQVLRVTKNKKKVFKRNHTENNKITRIFFSNLRLFMNNFADHAAMNSKFSHEYYDDDDVMI